MSGNMSYFAPFKLNRFASVCLSSFLFTCFGIVCSRLLKLFGNTQIPINCFLQYPDQVINCQNCLRFALYQIWSFLIDYWVLELKFLLFS